MKKSANPLSNGYLSLQFWVKPELKRKYEAVVYHTFGATGEKKKLLEQLLQDAYSRILEQKGITMGEFYEEYDSYMEIVRKEEYLKKKRLQEIKDKSRNKNNNIRNI
ncbi:hypothetical protein [Oceanotoga phage vB_OteS-UFV02]